MKSLSVIMPALNEEDNIAQALSNVIDALRKFNVDGEIIVVNDGSTDNTENIVKAMVDDNSNIKIVSHNTPQGIGASFWDGVRVASKDAVVMIPADGENDAAEIIRYLGLLDFVDIINPYVVNKHIRPLFRNILSNIFLLIINLTFNLCLNYTNGTVIYRRVVLGEVNPQEKGFFYQVEALIKLIKKGYMFAEVPYRLAERGSGKSKAMSWRSLKGVFLGYFRLVREIYFTSLYRNRGVFVPGSRSYEVVNG